MTAQLQAEKRNEVLAGILVAATALLVGYASGFGHLLGRVVPPMSSAEAAPGAAGGAAPVTAALATGAAGVAPGQGSTSGRMQPGEPATAASEDGTTSTTSVGDPASSQACQPDLASSVLDPFWMHVQKGHLEESPGQQVEDILSTDQYVKTHTVLLEDMLAPAYLAASHATAAAGIFWMHVEKGHLEESPGQQVHDILNTDQYVKTHTVLVEDMLEPLATSATGTC